MPGKKKTDLKIFICLHQLRKISEILCISCPKTGETSTEFTSRVALFFIFAQDAPPTKQNLVKF